MHTSITRLNQEIWEQEFKDLWDNLDYLRGIFLIKNILGGKEHFYTYTHSIHVSLYAYLIGQELMLDAPELNELVLTALLHDIGKAKVSKTILLKKGPLTTEEFGRVKSHVFFGADIIKRIKKFKHLDYNILCHHERWDGQGYPFGLKQEEIPLFSRIVAIADSYDAMTTERVYQKRVSQEEALKELTENANKQFSGELVKIFKDLILAKKDLNIKSTTQVV
ncbi:MAG: HD-GYP domain-containing protein [Clostridia bacterium]|jgi:HD-GYP domain-containing protein (c-di-GMP phosphodiesterase class II)|nr:HD-GYP domain-containing protein [Clostridia bacterium]